MNPKFWLAIAILTTITLACAYQRRTMTRALTQHRIDPDWYPDWKTDPVTVTCGDCGESYFCAPEGVRAAVQLHYSFHCSMSGYDHWRDAG